MLKKISLVTAGNMVNALLGFIFLWAVANSLSLEEFGRYALFASILLVLARITDFGTNSTFVAKSIIHKVSTEEFIGVKFILFVIANLLGLASLAFFNLFSLGLVLILIGSLTAYTMNYLLYAFYQKEEKYSYLVLLYTIPAIIKAVFAPLFVLRILVPTVSLAAGVFGLSIFAGLILLAFDNPIKGAGFRLRFGLIKVAWPAGISQIVTEMWPALTNAIANTIRGFTDVGIYALANKVSVVFTLISLSIFSVLLPKNAKRKKLELKYSFDEVFVLIGGVGLIGIAGVIASKFVVTKLFGPQFEESLDLLNILVFAATLSAISSFMENYFFVQEDTKKILIISLSKLGVFATGAFVLIPLLGLVGLAYSQLGAAIISTIITGIFIFLPSKRVLV